MIASSNGFFEDEMSQPHPQSRQAEQQPINQRQEKQQEEPPEVDGYDLYRSPYSDSLFIAPRARDDH